jgi:hypothetical protein
MSEKEFQLYVDSLISDKGGMLQALHVIEMKIDHIEFLVDVRAELIARINMN